MIMMMMMTIIIMSELTRVHLSHNQRAAPEFQAVFYSSALFNLPRNHACQSHH